MKFWEALKALEDGKTVKSTSSRNCLRFSAMLNQFISSADGMCVYFDTLGDLITNEISSIDIESEWEAVE